jgi:hypothetical protein
MDNPKTFFGREKNFIQNDDMNPVQSVNVDTKSFFLIVDSSNDLSLWPRVASY